jgi:hypothetical protein
VEALDGGGAHKSVEIFLLVGRWGSHKHLTQCVSDKVRHGCMFQRGGFFFDLQRAVTTPNGFPQVLEGHLVGLSRCTAGKRKQKAEQRHTSSLSAALYERGSSPGACRTFQM